MTKPRNPISEGARFRNPIRNPITVDGMFPPLPITLNLAGQWDPSDLASLDANSDGDPVGLEQDLLSGFGNDGTQSGASRPILKFGISGFTSGISVLEFDGSDDFMDVGDQASLENPDWTFFIVGRRRTLTAQRTYGGIQRQNDGGGGVAGILMDMDTTTTFRGLVTVGTNSQQTIIAGVPGTTSRIFTMRKSGTSFETWMGSTSLGTFNLSSSVMDYSVITTKRTLWGANHRDVGTPTQFQHFDGWLGERIAYSDAKNSGDRSIVWNYLSSKWGVAL